MKKHLLIATAASILVWGTVAASAQDDPDMTNMQQLEQAQQDPMNQDAGPDGDGHGRMRHCMRQCIRGEHMMGQGQSSMRHSMRQGGTPFAMRIIFALMDRDGDGTVSLQEFQTAHEGIFKAMDADKDGTVSMEEMRDFFQGRRTASPQQSAPKD